MKKIIISLFAAALVALGWYLFIKKHDYVITFKTKYGPSAIYYDFLDAKEFNNDTLLHTRKYSQIVQQKSLGDTLFTFQWNFEKASDSTTQTTVSIINESSPLAARLDVLNPLSSRYSTQLKSYFSEYNWLMDSKQEHYIIGQTLKDTTFYERDCVCTSGENSVDKKASEMLSQLSILDYFFLENKLKPTGDPFLILKSWNHENDWITFDFCFPIKVEKELKSTNKTFISKIETTPAYTSSYWGNYKFSHRAWAELENQITKYNHSINDTIIEVYHNSPLVDTDAKKWRATLYKLKK